MRRTKLSLCCVLALLGPQLRSATLSPSTSHSWTGSWYVAPLTPAPKFSNATLRTVVHLNNGGDHLRVRLSNLYGTTQLKIGAMRISTDQLASDVSFDGHPSVIIEPGGDKVSDPLTFATHAGTALSVAIYYPDTTPDGATLHWSMPDTADSETTVNPGDSTHQQGPSLSDIRLPFVCFLTGIDVDATPTSGNIVALGDSITDGGLLRWPALLTRRLAAQNKNYGVINAGISGNRLLSDASGWGESALKRFDRDVLGQPDVKYVILFEGINDIGNMNNKDAPPPTLERFAEAIRQLAARAHQHGIKFYAATITPFGRRTPIAHQDALLLNNMHKLRQLVNHWIRTSPDIDGYFDFDHALANPTKPNRLKFEFDSGDHVHPNVAGEDALSKAISLTAFE